jgi:3-isopropylmalate/(R)-2-methylmalate dehydratase small subunit
MKPFTTLTSRIIALPIDNIDTDRIIPARFLKTTGKAGLGQHLFADWPSFGRQADGAPRPDFALRVSEPPAQVAHTPALPVLASGPGRAGASVLLVGDNFGCGSSREHAPWALMDFGFQAVISTSFADIFRNNALKNGLLPVVVDAETHRQLFSLVGEEPEMQITIDLASQTLRLPDGRGVTFPIDEFSKVCLLEGVDQLGYLLKHAAHVAAYEETHPPRVSTAIHGKTNDR